MPAKKVTKSAKKAPAAKVVATSAATSKALALKTICAGLGLDPKTARRVLRKRMRSDVPGIAKFHSIGNRWNLASKDAALVRTTLKEYVEARA
jgi:hypothetical protein